MVGSKVKSGRILLAEPFMLDPNFKRATVILCEHNDQGSLGFIMNKPLEVQLTELIPDFPEFEAEVSFGGPVQTDTIHYLHSLGELLEDSVQVCPGVYWGGDFEKLKFLIASKLVKAGQVRFFVGYSGWSEGQLEDEMEYGSWILANMHANYLFKSAPDDLWRQIMFNKGQNYSVISEMPEDVSLN